MATCRVVIALALFALVHHVVSTCIPRSVVVQGQATLTTISGRVVLALALAVYHQVHAFSVVLHAFVSCAARRMSVAKAAAEYFQLVDGVKVICSWLFVQADVIASGLEKRSQMNSQIGYFQEVLQIEWVNVFETSQWFVKHVIADRS